MQVNSISNTNFKAKIIPSEYLNKAIELAKKDAASGTDVGRRRAARFYNNLKTIESDTMRDELSISNSNAKLLPVLRLDKTRRFIPTYKSVEDNVGSIVQDSINMLVEDIYFRWEICRDAAKVNLERAFDVWVK